MDVQLREKSWNSNLGPLVIEVTTRPSGPPSPLHVCSFLRPLEESLLNVSSDGRKRLEWIRLSSHFVRWMAKMHFGSCRHSIGWRWLVHIIFLVATDMSQNGSVTLIKSWKTDVLCNELALNGLLRYITIPDMQLRSEKMFQFGGMDKRECFDS